MVYDAQGRCVLEAVTAPGKQRVSVDRLALGTYLSVVFSVECRVVGAKRLVVR